MFQGVEKANRVVYPFTFSYLATKVLHDKFNACKFVTIYLRKYSASHVMTKQEAFQQ